LSGLVIGLSRWERHVPAWDIAYKERLLAREGDG
jgi:hypothetical protein